MSREWAPGDVAMVVSSDGVERPAIAVSVSWGESAEWVFATNGRRGMASQARPLVIIDPEDAEQAERLEDLIWATIDPATGSADMQAALRQFANPTPPKPEEPKGLGAVVEVRSGDLYVRDKTTTTVAHWKRARGEEQGQRHRWSDLNVVRVLSEGVS